jgi:O-antigen/teichoic acid export membrane protein
LGLNNFVGFGLFAGEIFGNFIALLKLKKNRSKLKRKKTIKFNVSYYKKLFIKNFKFPVNKALPDFLSLFSESIIVILILREFGVAYVGYLELSYKILVIPVTVVGAAIAPLILQKASDAINNNLQLFPQLRTIFIGLVLISLSFLFFVMYALEPLFILFFEENWIQSYVFISILVFLVCLQLIISPMGELLILIDKLKVDAFWKYLKILSLCVLLLFEYKNVNSLVQIYTIASGILYLIYFFIIIYYVRNYDLSLKNNV